MSFKTAILKHLKPDKVKLMLDQEMDTLDQYLLDNPQKEFSPMMLLKVFDPVKEQFNTIVALVELNESRFKMMEALGAHMAKENHMVLAVILMHEVWHVQAKLGDPYIQPSQHPDRIGAMCLSLLTIDGQSHVRLFKTEYNSKGHIYFGKSLLDQGGVFQNELVKGFFRGFLGEIREKLYQ